MLVVRMRAPDSLLLLARRFASAMLTFSALAALYVLLGLIA